MRPRYPLLRTLLAALWFALLVAAGVFAAARMTLPPAAEPGTVADAALASGAAAAPGDSAAGATSAAPGDSAAGATSAAPGDSAAGDTSAAAGTPAGPAPTTAAAATGARGAAGAAIAWPTTWNAVAAAPERWLVLAAFAGTLLAALLTALIAVRGSAPAAEEEGPVRRRSDAVQLLAVLQREGRLVDFLREEIEPFTDAQIGAAVRAIHAGCRKALEEHVALGPVLAEEEGAQITVPAGFDPSAVRLTGNVAGDPPFNGALRHRGWRAIEVHLPTDARGQDPEVVAPAEVEIP